jgi:hypothetical protein
MWVGLAAAGLSFPAAAERDRLAEYSATIRPAKATLRKTEIREWIAGHGDWNAFGTFDIVAGDHRGSAEGDLAPRAHRKRSRRQRNTWKTPREKAETFPAQWQVGRTYDAFWNPQHPSGVFFDPVPVEEQARFVTGLRVAAPILFILGMVLKRSRRV